MTTIQLSELTRKKIEKKKLYPKESYDAVLKRMLESDQIPDVEEMFRIGQKMNQAKHYSSKEIVEMSHEYRKRNDKILGR